MDHFYHGIHGFFGFENFYKSMVEHFESGARFVELGTYRGTSLAYLVVEIINSGKDIDVTCVDLFGLEHLRCHTYPELYDDFRKAMEPIWGTFTVLRMDSLEAVQEFDDGSLDMVFIDTSHLYEPCKAEIVAYLPKLKPGGILAGHDWHMDGVNTAVCECLPNDIHVSYVTWWYQIPGGEKPFVPEYGIKIDCTNPVRWPTGEC